MRPKHELRVTYTLMNSPIAWLPWHNLTEGFGHKFGHVCAKRAERHHQAVRRSIQMRKTCLLAPLRRASFGTDARNVPFLTIHLTLQRRTTSNDEASSQVNCVTLLGMSCDGLAAMARNDTNAQNMPNDTIKLGAIRHTCVKRAKWHHLPWHPMARLRKTCRTAPRMTTRPRNGNIRRRSGAHQSRPTPATTPSGHDATAGRNRRRGPRPRKGSRRRSRP